MAASCEAQPPPAMGANWSNATDLCGSPPGGQLEDAWAALQHLKGMLPWLALGHAERSRPVHQMLPEPEIPKQSISALTDEVALTSKN